MSKVIATALGTLCVSIFIAPLFCLIAWNTFAWEFNLPTFSYWHWMAVVLAIRFTLGKTKVNINKG